MMLFQKQIVSIFLVVLAFSFTEVLAQSRTKTNFGFEWEFKREEKEVSTVIKTPEKATEIELSYDVSYKAIHPNNPDVVFVYAKITDANETITPDATGEVTFALSEGNGELIGANPVQAEAGIATIILKSSNVKIPIKITASSENLHNRTLKISK